MFIINNKQFDFEEKQKKFKFKATSLLKESRRCYKKKSFHHRLRESKKMLKIKTSKLISTAVESLGYEYDYSDALIRRSDRIKSIDAIKKHHIQLKIAEKIRKLDILPQPAVDYLNMSNSFDNPMLSPGAHSVDMTNSCSKLNTETSPACSPRSPKKLESTNSNEKLNTTALFGKDYVNIDQNVYVSKRSV